MSKQPETGPSLRRWLEQQKRQAGRAANSSPFTRSGTSVTAEDRIEVAGQMQSSDYDGTSRADLGTAGWMLGPDDGGPSLLALNGIDVYADLAAKDVTILGLISDLTATQATLAAQQATLDAQQATLATTVSGLSTAQADLTAAVADIAALVGAQVTGVTKTTYVAGLSLNATRQSVAAVSVDVPAGFSVARVMAVSTLSAGSSSLDCITRIQGNDGGVVTAGYGFAASSHAISLPGLSGGTITASTLAASWPDASGRANTTILVLFFR